PTTFDRSMFAFPLEEMLQSWGVTVEHSHRLLATLVGALTLAILVAAAFSGGRRALVPACSAALAEVALVGVVILQKTLGGNLQSGLATVLVALSIASLVPVGRRGLRALAVGAHFAVIGQGLLGGTRVLENSPQLAFLHGACAQIFYALVAGLLVVSAPRWTGSPRSSGAAAPRRHDLSGLKTLALLSVPLVYGQIVLGAWLRHSGRSLPLVLHICAALLVVAVVLFLARALGRAAGEEPLFGRLRRWLLAMLTIQVLLGVAATVAILVIGTGFQGRVTFVEAVTATLHVGVGALLLAGCVGALLWSRRGATALDPVDVGALEGLRPSLEGGAG
ncbi:MAG: hypothetical protein V3T22_08905, partial [Planctomycetota bacterium]